MGYMRPKSAAMGVVDLAFLILHGRLVNFPDTGYEAYMVEVEQESFVTPEGVYIDPAVTGTVLYIFNIPPSHLTLREPK